jgi:hypothetical protein
VSQGKLLLCDERESRRAIKQLFVYFGERKKEYINRMDK